MVDNQVMSAFVKDYAFDNLSRIGEDGCSLGQRGIQNVEASNYMLQNFFSDDCTMKRPIEFATSQPNINFTGGHQVGAGGCNIDTNSQLLIGGSALTHPRCRISLLQRPFATVPFMGRGQSNPYLESQLQQGDYLTNKRSINLLSEQTVSTNYPLVPSIASTITNPVNLVEGVASEGWVRGGANTRTMFCDNGSQCKY
jgi:hypothetical protein